MHHYIKDPFYKPSVIKRFNQVAAQYERQAFLARLLGEELINRLTDIECQPKRILDLGGGTGLFSFALQEKFPDAELYCADIAFQMLQQAKQKRDRSIQNPIYLIMNDAENLAFQAESFDLVFCNCLLYCVEAIPQVLTQISYILKPQGVFLFSTLGRDTLKELKYCYQGLDKENHINPFPDMHDLGDSLLKMGFENPVMDREEIVLFYPTVREILKDIKYAGENVILEKGKMGLKTASWLTQLSQHYEPFRNSAGQLPTTIEVIYGYALGAQKSIPESQRNINSTASKQKHIELIEI